MQYEENLSGNYIKFGPVVQKEMSFKDVYSLALVTIVTEGANQYVQFVRGHFEKYVYEILIIWDSGS